MKKIMMLSVLVSFLLILSGSIHLYAAETATVTGEIIDTYCFAL